MKKGNQLFIEGKIKYGQYTDNNGITRYTTDITVTDYVLLTPRNTTSEVNNFPTPDQFVNPSQPQNSSSSSVVDMLAKNLTPDVEDDDIPF